MVKNKQKESPPRYLTLFRMRGGGAGGVKKAPPTGFSHVTSTNVVIGH